MAGVSHFVSVKYCQGGEVKMADYCHCGKVKMGLRQDGEVKMADFVMVERLRWRTVSGWRR